MTDQVRRKMRISRDPETGIYYKLCKGPTHSTGKWIPLADFYLRSKPDPYLGVRLPRGECKACANTRTARKKPPEYSGFVYSSRVIPFLKRLEAIYGSKEKAAIATGVGISTWYKISKGTQAKVRRDTLAKVIRHLNGKPKGVTIPEQPRSCDEG